MRKKYVKLTKKLRKSMTDAERKLWRFLKNKNLGVKFRRQEPIGNYIVDFVCYERRLIIEIDGGQHCESKEDRIRDDWLEKKGFKVLRFWNNEVLGNIEGVMEMIKENISPSPHPSPTRGEGEKFTSPSPNPSRQGRGGYNFLPLKGALLFHFSPLDGGEKEGGENLNHPLVKKRNLLLPRDESGFLSLERGDKKDKRFHLFFFKEEKMTESMKRNLIIINLKQRLNL